MSRESLTEFYERTGLILVHKVRVKNGTPYYFTMYGVTRYEEPRLEWYQRVSHHHILVITEEDSLDESTLEWVPNADRFYEMRNKIYLKNIMEESIEEKAQIVKEYREKGFFQSRYDKRLGRAVARRGGKISYDFSDVKWLSVDTFGELLLLHTDGRLFRQGWLYDTEVEALFEPDAQTLIIVFKDGHMEYLHRSLV